MASTSLNGADTVIWFKIWLNKLKAASHTPSCRSVIIMAGFKMNISNKTSSVP